MRNTGPAVMAALERVTEAAKKRDIPVAALATLDDPAQMQYWVDRGVHSTQTRARISSRGSRLGSG